MTPIWQRKKGLRSGRKKDILKGKNESSICSARQEIRGTRMEGNEYNRQRNIPVKGGRMANLELLRCIAMLMVTVLHYLGKGNLLADLTGESLGAGETAAWVLESFCIVAVNVYMFFSGYFLCDSPFKPSRLIQLWLQIEAYSIGFGLIGALTGVLRETAFDRHYLLTLLFPVSMGHYWFMTAYVYLYLLLPFVGPAVRQMTKRQHQAAVGLLLFAFCILKSILPVRFEMDGRGYDCLWYLCVFLTAAYIRRYGSGLMERKRRGACLYIVCCLLIFGGTMGLRGIYLRTGSLEEVLKICLEYNHLLPFLAALGLFALFCGIKIKGKAARLVNTIAPYTLGVYLLHENLGLRYTWQDWLGAGHAREAMERGGPGAVIALLLWTALAAVCMFACGILADMARKVLFGLLHRGVRHILPYRTLLEKIQAADALFREERAVSR